MKKGITLIAALAVVLAITSGAFAAQNLITSSQIKDGAVSWLDLSPTVQKALKKDENGLKGAFYATAFYNAGDTNAGAIASVACDAEKTDYVAISGGVQVLGLGEGANSRNTPVSSSFPGRMDWAAGAPKPNRLDGWIVQFGGNAGATSDKDPERIKVWALCLPGESIPVSQTYQQVG